MNIPDAPSFTALTDLAAARLGGRTLACSDDFFAEKENLIQPGRGIFIADKYTDRGKWMDGWESRRKRTEGNDWCIVQLATAGRIHGVDIDTNFFLGNHPPHASIEAAYITGTNEPDLETISWKEILPKSPLQAGAQNFYAIDDRNVYTHIRLHIYPDGGVARLKVYGEVAKELKAGETVNLAAAINGARAILCNDMFFSHMENLLLPGKGINMGDGWETKRSRVPGNRDWVIIRLAHKGTIEKILVDTHHFKGNYPDRCLIEGCNIPYREESKLDGPNISWTTVLPESKLQADNEHIFQDSLSDKGPFTHLKLTIIPDGGVSRLQVWGKIVQNE